MIRSEATIGCEGGGWLFWKGIVEMGDKSICYSFLSVPSQQGF